LPSSFHPLLTRNLPLLDSERKTESVSMDAEISSIKIMRGCWPSLAQGTTNHPRSPQQPLLTRKAQKRGKSLLQN